MSNHSNNVIKITSETINLEPLCNNAFLLLLFRVNSLTLYKTFAVIR